MASKVTPIVMTETSTKVVAGAFVLSSNNVQTLCIEYSKQSSSQAQCLIVDKDKVDELIEGLIALYPEKITWKITLR